MPSLECAVVNTGCLLVACLAFDTGPAVKMAPVGHKPTVGGPVCWAWSMKGICYVSAESYIIEYVEP